MPTLFGSKTPLPRAAPPPAAAPAAPVVDFTGWDERMFAPENVMAAANRDNPTYGMTPEQVATYQQNEQRDARFGNDMAWLDPAFQQQAALLGQSAGSQAQSDPMAAVAQYGAMNQAAGLAQTPLAFQGSGQQEALGREWQAVQNGQGAPQFMGGSQQQQLMQQLLGVRAPQFSGDADQRAVLNQALGLSSNTGPNALQFDSGARQQEQYGNLRDIIAGGGATAIEMADRQRQRGDSEAWLRGQREADMADYAERGLTGSGMELLSLSGDRQAAAGRNSLADLETAKALEERRLGAINSAAGLASTMRGNTTEEQALLNSRAMSGLSAAASTANAMRDANYNEQTFVNESARQQALQAAGIAETMRNQGFNESTYLDKRMLDALNQRTGLAETTRNQQLAEQTQGRQATMDALGLQGQIAGQVRGQSAQEAQYRASAEDERLRLNQAAENAARTDNTAWNQTGYTNMMGGRQSWEELQAQLNARASAGLYGEDAADARAAADQAERVGSTTSRQFNDGLTGRNSDLLGLTTGANADAAAAARARTAANTGMMGTVGDTWTDLMMSAARGAPAGSSGGSAGGSVPAAGGAVNGGYGTNLGNFGSQLQLGSSMQGLTSTGASSQPGIPQQRPAAARSTVTGTNTGVVGTLQPQTGLQTQQRPALASVPQAGTDAYADLQKRLGVR